MNILSWILFGLIAGAIAKLVMPGKDPGGCLVTIGIGILGAMLGGLIATRVLDMGPVTGFNMRSFAIAIFGSILLLVVYRLLVGRRRG
ncbi:MAG: GlsB/YeaQ/YmgE family stress response membrane protein [Longimicrobiales bacterium]